MEDAKSILEQSPFEPLIATCMAYLGRTERPLSWQVYPGTISIVLADHQKRVLNRSEMEQLHATYVLEREKQAAAEAEAKLKAEAERKAKAEAEAAAKAKAEAEAGAGKKK